MSKDFFKVPKSERPVAMWVHPEGKVLGSIYVREQSLHHIGEESAFELFNQEEPFVVLHRNDVDEFRFYNKSSVVRVEIEYPTDPDPEAESVDCELHMMDGSLLLGKVCGIPQPGQRRLYDHLNKDHQRFIPMYLDDGKLCLINKNYIIYARSL